MAIPSNTVAAGGATKESEYDALYDNAILANTGGTAGGAQSVPGVKTWEGNAIFEGTLAVGIAAGDGTAHIHTASAGSVTAPGASDDLVVENDNAGGISVLVPDIQNASINFGSPSLNNAASVLWNHDADIFQMSTNKAGAVLKLQAGTSDLGIYIDENGKVGMGNTTNPSDNADLTLEGGALCIKETTTPTDDTNYGKVYCKNDNKIYFQDGAGAEHEIAFV